MSKGCIGKPSARSVVSIACLCMAICSAPGRGQAETEKTAVFLPSGQRLDQENLALLELKPRSFTVAVADVFGVGDSEDEKKERLWIARATNVGSAELRRRLVDLEGLAFLSALPNGYSIIRGSKHHLREIHSSPWLETVAELPPDSKVSPQLQRLPELLSETSGEEWGEVRSANGKLVGETESQPAGELELKVGIEIWLFDSVPVDDFLQWLGTRRIHAIPDPDTRRLVRASLVPWAELSNIAERLEVERISLANSAVSFDELPSLSSAGARDCSPDGLTAPGLETIFGREPGIFPQKGALDGSGQLVGHADTGLDSGASIPHRHPDLKGIFKGSSLRPPSGSDTAGGWADRSGHGTHTAGLIIGNGTSSGERIVGVAPRAQLIHHALGTETSLIQIDAAGLTKILDESLADGARIHSDSWGFRLGDYSLLSEAADRWSWNSGDSKDMLIVVAAGNDGQPGLSGTLSDPAAAKNVLTVGAIDSETELVPAYSSRGPTRDGRSKPDLIAPGNWLLSTRPRFSRPWLKDSMDSLHFLEWQQFGDTTWKALEDGREGPGLSDSPFGDYANNVKSLLVSPPIPTIAQRVKFWARWDVPETKPFGIRLMFGTENSWYSRKAIRLLPRNPDWPDGNWLSIRIPNLLRELGQPFVRFGIELTSDGAGTGSGFLFDDFEVSALKGCSISQEPENRMDFGLDVPYTIRQAAAPQMTSALEGWYFLDTGTSMSAALVSGLAARYRQFLQGPPLHLAQPSPQALKAALINGTIRPPAVPDPAMGWGTASMKFTEQPGVVIQDRRKIAKSHEKHAFFFEVNDAGLPLRATLVWWDPAGARLINDLDLVLISPDREEIGGPADRFNTVEDIQVANPKAGQWRAEVRAHRIEAGPAEFALVLSGAIENEEEDPGSGISAQR
jgi:subtilisin family serine protease